MQPDVAAAAAAANGGGNGPPSTSSHSETNGSRKTKTLAPPTSHSPRSLALDDAVTQREPQPLEGTDPPLCARSPRARSLILFSCASGGNLSHGASDVKRRNDASCMAMSPLRLRLHGSVSSPPVAETDL